MIAELFYPKELKDVIADLRAQGDLNEQALKFLNNNTWVMAFSFFAISLFIFYVCANHIEWLISLVFVLLIVFIVTTYLDKKRSFQRMMVYTRGEKRLGTVERSVTHKTGMLALPMKGLLLSDDKDGSYLDTGPFMVWASDDKIPNNGEKVEFYTLGNKSYQNMPHRAEIMKDYCLSASMVRGQL